MFFTVVNFIERRQNFGQQGFMTRAVAKVLVNRVANGLFVLAYKLRQAIQLSDSLGIVRHRMR